MAYVPLFAGLAEAITGPARYGARSLRAPKLHAMKVLRLHRCNDVKLFRIEKGPMMRTCFLLKVRPEKIEGIQSPPC